ncbi:MAG: hypothetical protein M1839_005876 [Geoglossum umbratile]|nr:MAG: hypothetical protein M1839_005876 [Geoglossum umbratile]
MRSLAIIAPCIALIKLVQAANFVLHDSCSTKSKAEPAFDEAIKMAKKAVERIQDGNDQDTEDLFKTVWKVSRNQEPKPLDIFTAIAGLQKGSTGTDATVTVYCDNDNRWVKQNDPNGNEVWWDAAMKIAGKKDPGCKRGPGALAVTYSNTKVSRSAITMCDTIFRRPYATIQEIIDSAPNGDLASPPGEGITDYNVVSRTALHELAHAFPARTHGYNVDKGYKWVNIFPMSHGDSIVNADSYAYFGQISFMKNHRLSTVEADREKGVIVRVPPPATKRATSPNCRRMDVRRVDPDCLM